MTTREDEQLAQEVVLVQDDKHLKQFKSLQSDAENMSPQSQMSPQ